MAERGLRLRLGLFVATTLAVLFVLVVLFGGAPTVFSNRSKYTVLFSEAPGIAAGTPVRKSGVRIGDVTSLDLDGETGQVRVGVQIDKRYAPRRGEDPTITRGILSGDTALDFVPHSNPDGVEQPRGEPYPAGSDIPGVTPPNARTLLNQASAVLPSAQDSLGQIVQSAKRLEQAVPKVEKAFDEIGAFARSGRELVPELRQTNTKVQELLGSAPPDDKPPAGPRTVPVALRAADPEPPPATVREALAQVIALLRALQPAADDLRSLVRDNGPELNRTLKSVREAADRANDLLNPDNRKAVAATVQNLSTASADLTRTIRLAALVFDQAEKTLKEFNARVAQSERALSNIEKITAPFAQTSDQIAKDVSTTAANLSAASEQLSKALTEARAALQLIGKSEGTLGKVIADPSLYNNLNAATVEAARTLARAEKIARDLEVFADKIARKPETLGVGGALHPSTGLKESPLAPLPPTPLPAVPPAAAPTVPPPAGSPPIPPVSGYRPPAGDLPPR